MIKSFIEQKSFNPSISLTVCNFFIGLSSKAENSKTSGYFAANMF